MRHFLMRPAGICPLVRRRFSGHFFWTPSPQAEVFLRKRGRPVLLVGSGDVEGGGFHVVLGAAHGHGYPGEAQHLDLVLVVPMASTDDMGMSRRAQRVCRAFPLEADTELISMLHSPVRKSSRTGEMYMLSTKEEVYGYLEKISRPFSLFFHPPFHNTT